VLMCVFTRVCIEGLPCASLVQVLNSIRAVLQMGFQIKIRFLSPWCSYFIDDAFKMKVIAFPRFRQPRASV